MKTSDQQDKIVAALFEARKVIPAIAKTKEGQSGNRKFNYAPLDAILDAVKPSLEAQGLLLTHGMEGHTLTTRLDHVSGQWRELSMPVNVEHANMQSYGIELTYRRRYSVQLILGIVTEEDTDIRDKQKRAGKDFTEDKKSGSITPTTGAEEFVTEARYAELQGLSEDYVAAWDSGKSIKVIDHFYRLPNEEQIVMTKLLQTRSDIRREIKANSPHQRKAA